MQERREGKSVKLVAPNLSVTVTGVIHTLRHAGIGKIAIVHERGTVKLKVVSWLLGEDDLFQNDNFFNIYTNLVVFCAKRT